MRIIIMMFWVVHEVGLLFVSCVYIYMYIFFFFCFFFISFILSSCYTSSSGNRSYDYDGLLGRMAE